jgi:hypothetical protein|tara:strand:+ start:64 stop:840 length:777 start_codon:yes stop_codon:yes gene_type:complete
MIRVLFIFITVRMLNALLECSGSWLCGLLAIRYFRSLLDIGETLGMVSNRKGEEIPTLNAVDKCPHCGVASPYLPLQWQGHTKGSKDSHVRLWGVFLCNSCGGLIAAASNNPDYLDFVLNYPNLIFPTPKRANEDIPEVARRYLQQAMDTIHAPDAAAVMAGSAVDAMLKDKGFVEGSLYSRIDSALSEGLLTQDMANWAHEVRLGSNRPRHADGDNPHVTSTEAEQSVDFAEALGNFLFVLTARIQRGIVAAQASAS